jgi:hypothetical protein
MWTITKEKHKQQNLLFPVQFTKVMTALNAKITITAENHEVLAGLLERESHVGNPV